MIEKGGTDWEDEDGDGVEEGSYGVAEPTLGSVRDVGCLRQVIYTP